MRKLLNRKSCLKLVSALLVLSMLMGTVGNYPIVSKAADATVTVGDFTEPGAGTITVAENVAGGVKVTHSASVQPYQTLTTKNAYDATQGVHFEIEGITTSFTNGYSFQVNMGYAAPKSSNNGLNYEDNAVHMLISSNGNYKVWKTGDWDGARLADPSLPNSSIFAAGTLENKPVGNSLSFDIRITGDGKYELTVAGNEPIAIEESSANWWWHSDSAFKNARFSFQIWPAITNTDTYSVSDWWKNISAGATYVIKNISTSTFVTLDRSKVTLGVGKEATLNATVSPESATDKSVVWTSDNEAVATVENGVVKAVAKGTATITAKSANTAKTATCKISVIDTTPAASDFATSSKINVEDCTEGGVKVTHTNDVVAYETLTTQKTYDATQGVHLEMEGISTSYSKNEYSFMLYMGHETGYNSNQGVNYAAEAINMAISSNGNYKVWRTSQNSQKHNPAVDDADIMAYGTLKNPPNEKILSLDIRVLETGKYELTIEGNETIVLEEPGTPWFPSSVFKKARFGFMIWPAITDTTTYSLGDMFSNISKGATYMIKDISKSVATVEKVTLDYGEWNLVPGAVAELSATVSPEAASDKTLTWASDKEDVATVDQNGKVTAVATGTANITATASNGVKATCVVTVSSGKAAGIVTKSDINNGSYTAKEVPGGVQITYPQDAYFSGVSTMHPQKLDRGFLYRITDIKKTDASATADYSLAIAIGNMTSWDESTSARRSNQWYDKQGYMILYGKSGNFVLIRNKVLDQNFNVGDASKHEVIAAEKIEPLGDSLTLYVKEDGDNWTLVINDTHSYTFSNLNTHNTGSHEYWFSVGALSDFTVTESTPISGLNFWGDASANKKCAVNFTISTIAPTVSTLFTDGMMFQQNKPMNVWGYGIAGTTATAKLYKGEELLETKTATVSSAGRWDVSFTARAGSYDTYKMDIQVGEKAHQVIDNILIGELWVAAGQSNMALKVSEDMNAETILAAANNSSLRFYVEADYAYDYVGTQPAYPAVDVPNSQWVYGNDADKVKGVTAIGYTFAKTLQENLDVPVGIIDTAIGGTYIEAWLSRSAIESDATVLAALKKTASPYAAAWYYGVNTFAQNAGNMSTLYNGQIGALEGMNVAGTIWYQGESNEWNADIYDDELDLLKRSWSKVFGYENGDMPFIFTQIAPYEVGTSEQMVKSYMALYMEQAWKRSADKNTAMLTLYDLPLEHMKDGVSSHPIHPRTKTPVAERFALAAMNMVYNGGDEYTAPVYKSMEIKGDVAYVKFDRVGNDGLKTTDGSVNLHGFTIAGADGIFVNAEAEIVDKDTVKVWSSYVEKPQNVIYAFSDMNQGANLCNSVGIPVSPFRTVELNDTVSRPNSSLTYFVAQDWMYADKDVWVCTETGDTPADYYKYMPSFAVTGGTYTYDSATKEEGTASLKVTYSDDFTVSPILSYYSIKQDWSKFNYLAVSLKNADNVKVAMKLTSDGTVYTVPAVDGKDVTDIAGSQAGFTKVVFDLTKLNDSVLSALTDVSFVVTADKAGTMCFDNFLFGMSDPSQNEVVDYTDEFAALREGNMAPERDGYVFAGWYYNEACTESVEQNVTTLEAGRKAYAKFVPASVLSVKAQLKLPTGTTAEQITADSKVQMRLVTTVDTLRYKKVGFKVTSNGITKEFTTTTAYTSINAAGVKVEAKDFSEASTYFITKNLGNITVGSNQDREIIVQAFWETMDGTIVYGEASTKTIRQGLNALNQTDATDYSR